MILKSTLQVLLMILAAAEVHAQSESRYTTDWNTNESRKTFNIQIQPLPALAGLPVINGTYLINKRFAVGPEIAYLVNDSSIKESVKRSDSSYDRERIDAYEVEAHMLGLRADIALDQGLDSDTFYATAMLYQLHVSVKDTVSSEKAEIDGSNLKALIGYQWMWENFNIRLGGGYSLALSQKAKSTMDDVDKKDLEKGYSGAALEFGLGWAL